MIRPDPGKPRRMVKDAWDIFNKLFRKTSSYLSHRETFIAFTVDSIIRHYPHVRHMELRVVVGKDSLWTCKVKRRSEFLGLILPALEICDNEPLHYLPPNEVAETYMKIEHYVNERDSNKNFSLGVIACERRTKNLSQIQESYQTALEMRNRTEMIVGFDLVGQETDENMDVIQTFVEDLCHKGLRERLPLVLHTGERTEHIMDNFGKLIVNCSDRIGHGFGILSQKNDITDVIILEEKGVEFCPLSNLFLSYTADLSVHPAASLLTNGRRVSISNDDPRLFGYAGVEFDWYASLLAFRWNISHIRQVIHNGISTALVTSHRRAELKDLEAKDWTKFIEILFMDGEFMTQSPNWNSQSMLEYHKSTLKLIKYANDSVKLIHIDNDNTIAHGISKSTVFSSTHPQFFRPCKCRDTRSDGTVVWRDSTMSNHTEFSDELQRKEHKGSEGFGWSMQLLHYVMQLEIGKMAAELKEEMGLPLLKIDCYMPLNYQLSPSQIASIIKEYRKLDPVACQAKIDKMRSATLEHLEAMKEKRNLQWIEDNLMKALRYHL